jgi:hypothetical protein
MSAMFKSAWFWLVLNLLAISLFTAAGPAERSLGTNVRVVYLHGVWVWAAMAGFLAAGLVGLIGLITQRSTLQRWSRALGRTGLLFWITYLPISLWAMQTNWNGMFLAEPRFRVAVVFAIGGLLLQVGVTIAEDPAWASLANILYITALLWVLRTTPNVMHPSSPIFSSDSWRIQVYFLGLLALVLLFVGQVAYLLYRAGTSNQQQVKALEIGKSES